MKLVIILIENAYLMLDFFLRGQFHPFTIITHFESVLAITPSPNQNNNSEFKHA